MRLFFILHFQFLPLSKKLFNQKRIRLISIHHIKIKLQDQGWFSRLGILGGCMNMDSFILCSAM